LVLRLSTGIKPPYNPRKSKRKNENSKSKQIVLVGKAPTSIKKKISFYDFFKTKGKT